MEENDKDYTLLCNAQLDKGLTTVICAALSPIQPDNNINPELIRIYNNPPFIFKWASGTLITLFKSFEMLFSDIQKAIDHVSTGYDGINFIDILHYSAKFSCLNSIFSILLERYRYDTKSIESELSNSLHNYYQLTKILVKFIEFVLILTKIKYNWDINKIHLFLTNNNIEFLKYYNNDDITKLLKPNLLNIVLPGTLPMKECDFELYMKNIYVNIFYLFHLSSELPKEMLQYDNPLSIILLSLDVKNFDICFQYLVKYPKSLDKINLLPQIIKSFINNGFSNLIYIFYTCILPNDIPPELLLQLYFSSNHIIEAFSLQRSSNNLLKEFITLLYKSNNINQLLYLPINDQELDYISGYLFRNHYSRDIINILIGLQLKFSHIREALALHQYDLETNINDHNYHQSQIEQRIMLIENKRKLLPKHLQDPPYILPKWTKL